MKITKITIKNFRNYKDLSVKFNDNLNVFVGDNAQGKTNLIESLYVLGITKSHRTLNERKLIKEGEEFLRIFGTIKSGENSKKLEVLINNKGKIVKVNNKIKKRTSEYLSNLLVVLFCPDSLDIVKGNPSVRRRFLNIELGQLDNKYLKILNEYNTLLKNRNEYFKREQIINEYLDIVDKQLSQKAAYIYEKRNEFIKKLNCEMVDIYKKISNGDIIEIKYETNIDIDEKDIEESIFKKLKNNIKRDRLLGVTTIGPHRDDFSFYINNHKINEYGSQGQQRLSALCLKLAEIEIIKKKYNEYPILLLDDIFSELDKKRRNAVFKYIDKGIQTFISVTDIKDIAGSILKSANVYKISNGKISLKNN